VAIAYRDSAGAFISANGQNLSVTIPATVVGGDGLILVADISATATVSTPSGWAFRDSVVTADTTNTCYIFSRVAAADSAGSTVTLVTSSPVPRGAIAVAAYSGTDPGDPIAEIIGSAFGANSTSHTVSSLVTDAAGQWLVEVIGSKSPVSNPITSYTRSGLNLRRAVYSGAATGQSAREVAIADDATANTSGATIGGGGPWVSDVATSDFAGFTIALAAASGIQTVHPISDVTTTNWTPNPALTSGLPQASLLSDNADGTYVESSAAPSALVYETQLGTARDPGPGEDLTLTVRIRDVNASSATHLIELRQGGTTIDSLNHTTVVSSWTDVSFTIAAADVAGIDFGQPLSVRLTATAA
jgi:hypothetical protein